MCVCVCVCVCVCAHVRFQCREFPSDLTSVLYRQVLVFRVHIWWSFIDRVFSHPASSSATVAEFNQFNFVLCKKVPEMCKGSVKTPIQAYVLKWGSGYAMLI